MTKTLEFIFDFGSPNAYRAYKALPPILARTGAGLRIVPCLLGGIFKATLSLRSNGMIDMIDDDVLMAPRADLREA